MRAPLRLLALLAAWLLVLPAPAEAGAKRGASAKLAKQRKKGRVTSRRSTRARRIAALDRQKLPQDGVLRVRGRVVGAARPAGKPLVAALYRSYPRTDPGTGAHVPALTVPADGDGHFLLSGASPGQYWVAAFVDENGDGKWQSDRELGGVSAPTNPIEVDAVRDFMTVEVEVDPLYVELRTRFLAGTDTTPPRHVLEGAYSSFAGQGALPAEALKITTPAGPAKPGDPVAARYLVEVTHAGLQGGSARRQVVPASFGALPTLVSPPSGQPVAAGQDLAVRWTAPAWGNDASCVLRGVDGKVLWRAAGPAPLVVPAVLLRQGQRGTLVLEAARLSAQQGGVVARSFGRIEQPIDVGPAVAQAPRPAAPVRAATPAAPVAPPPPGTPAPSKARGRRPAEDGDHPESPE